jgi:hypothetical protein
MFTTIRKCFFVVAIASLSFTFVHCPAYATLYTVDAITDAGLYPGQPDFVDFLLSNGSTVNVRSSTSPPFTDSTTVYNYATANGIPAGWTLQSAGNIWNSSQTTVGVTTPLLSAGTYQISVVSGAFTYDSFDWSSSPNYYQQWLWFLNIESDVPPSPSGGTSQSLNYYTLGSSTLYGTPAAAYNASKNSLIDITLASPGYLNFWIYDTNSIDNAGSLEVNVAAVPQPSSLWLLITGVLILILRSRQHIIG